MDFHLKISHWWSWMDYIRWCNLQKKNMFHLPHLIWPLSWTNFKTTNLTSKILWTRKDVPVQNQSKCKQKMHHLVWNHKQVHFLHLPLKWTKLNRPTRNQCKVIYFKFVMLNWILETHCDPFLNMTIWTWPLWYWVFDLEES